MQSIAPWLRSPWRWLIIAAVGVAACALVYQRLPQPMMQALWIGLVNWTGVSIGAIGLLALYGLVGGRWGELLTPALAAAARPIWLMAVLFVPAVFQLPALFPWAMEHHSASDRLNFQHRYLSREGFLLRSGVYWALWLALAALLPRRLTASGPETRPNPRLCALALPLVVLAVTFSSIDWMMSLEADWYSTAYGVIVLAGQGAAAFAFAILAASVLLAERTEAAAEPISWNDVGNLLMAAVCFWMYVTFAQFLIVWSGNLPEEIPWYLKRADSPWREVAVALVLLHWVVPFAALLQRDLKRNPSLLAGIAALVLVMHAVDVWWLMAPSMGYRPLAAVACDWLGLATVGAWWMFVFALRPPQWATTGAPPQV